MMRWIILCGAGPPELGWTGQPGAAVPTRTLGSGGSHYGTSRNFRTHGTSVLVMLAGRVLRCAVPLFWCFAKDHPDGTAESFSTYAQKGFHL